MKKNAHLVKTSLLFFLLSTASVKTFAFDAWWHKECTRKAMAANGFSDHAIVAVQFSNYLTDFYSILNMVKEKLSKTWFRRISFNSDPAYDYMHFDAVYTAKDIERNWELLLINTIRTLRKYAVPDSATSPYRLQILFNIIGSSLHMVQDFYSHSNWVNLYASMKHEPVPIWYEKPGADREKLYLVTGKYPDSCELPFLTHSQLNKDCSARKLNAEAVNAAERASADWIKRLIDSVATIPWAELKAYNIQDETMKNFLLRMDAAFLVSGSVAANHYDGEKPVCFEYSKKCKVFGERIKASGMFIRTVRKYASNVKKKSNPLKLPSPYWAGHYKDWNITRELAVGLILNEQEYIPSAK